MVIWPDGVNKNAYGLDIASGDNVIRTELDSGKIKTYRRNSEAKKTFSFNLYLDDRGDNSEFKKFDVWFRNSLKDGALSFVFPDLMGSGNDKHYLVTDEYSAVGQRYKEVSLTVVEV
jgi:hypothetical protein